MSSNPILFREIERIIAVLIGGAAIYLGYRLFLNVPNERDSEGRIKLPGDISIFLTRVGPGVFFALFGTIVIAASFYFTVTVQTSNGTNVYSGFGEQPRTSDVYISKDMRGDVQSQIAFLNKTLPLIYETLGEVRQDEIERYLCTIKLQLMQSVWGTDWGDLATFRAWAEFGTTPPKSEEFHRARLFYEHGEGGGP